MINITNDKTIGKSYVLFIIHLIVFIIYLVIENKRLSECIICKEWYIPLDFIKYIHVYIWRYRILILYFFFGYRVNCIWLSICNFHGLRIGKISLPVFLQVLCYESLIVSNDDLSKNRRCMRTCSYYMWKDQCIHMSNTYIIRYTR